MRTGIESDYGTLAKPPFGDQSLSKDSEEILSVGAKGHKVFQNGDTSHSLSLKASRFRLHPSLSEALSRPSPLKSCSEDSRP